MDSEILFISALAVIVWALILKSIISNASRSKQIEWQLKLQTELLAKIAETQGVSNLDLDKILNSKPVSSDDKLIAMESRK